jgi:peptidoglycan biosynthesis protein MviN/MurJ (putative lipid II flippase)
MMLMRMLLTAITAGSSIASFAAYALLLRFLGATAEVDLLFYAGSLPVAASGMVAGVLLYLLPPRMTRLSSRHQDTATRALALLVVAVTLVAMSGGLAGLLLQPERRQFWELWTGFALFAGLSLVVSVQSCLAQARGDFIATGWAPLAMSGGLFSGAMVAIATREVHWVLTGQLVGCVVASQWLALRLRMSWRGLRAQRIQAMAALRPLRSSVVPITLATAAFTLFQPLDAWLCRSLGEGALTTMSFAQRVLVAVSTVVSLGAYVIAAKLSRDILREGGISALRRQACKEAARLVVAGIAAWLGYVLVGRWLLGLLLQSSTFNGPDLERLLSVLGWMLVGVGPMAAMPYLCRVFYSVKAVRFPAFLGAAIPLGYIVISSLLSAWIGIYALATAYVAVWWLALAVSMLMLKRLPD